MYGTWVKVEPTHYGEAVNGATIDLPVGTELLVSGARSGQGDLLAVDNRTYRSLQIRDEYLLKHWKKIGEDTVRVPQFRPSAYLPDATPSMEKYLRETDCGVHDFL